ncbi:MAG: hypothetical protein HYV13_02040 [Candidatus Doudnabacteria bacterium]|nr:hypothetical protein [Candidatus Doudnabacteria bacterium]
MDNQSVVPHPPREAMKIMFVAKFPHRHTLKEALRQIGAEVFVVDHKECLAKLVEVEPTHIIWEWSDGMESGMREVFLLNAKVLGIFVKVLSFRPTRTLPEAIRPFHHRLPLRVDEIVSILKRSDK